MHEATIAKSILQIAQQSASKIADASVDSIRVRIGTFRNVDPESLQFSFDSLKTEFERCQEAVLQLELVDAQAVCIKRRHTYTPLLECGFRCDKCGSGICELLAGNEMDVIGCTLSTPALTHHEETSCTKP